MFSSIERIVSFIGNLVAIIAFFAAVFGFFEPGFLPNFTPSSYSSAIAIIILFATLVGYGSATVIKRRIDDDQSFGFLVIIYCILFCIVTIYVEGMLTQNLPANESLRVSEKGRLFAGLIYPAVHFVIYLGRIWFPNGFNIGVYITSMFRSGFYIVLFNVLFYLASIPYLFLVLDNKFQY